MKTLLNRYAVMAGIALVLGCGDDDSDSFQSLCAGKQGSAGTQRMTIESNGMERTFTVAVPDSALTGRPAPLVALYHGVLADSASILALTAMAEKGDAEGFITVAGDGVERSWNAGLCCDPAATMEIDDVQFTRDMIAAVEEEYCIDRDRVFATGFSNGAAMTFRLLCEAGDLFAAYAPVAGSIASFPCEPDELRPVDIINSVDDPLVPFTLGEASFGAAVAINGCGDGRTIEQPADNTTCEVAVSCAADTRTALCGAEGLGHEWPGGASNPEGPFFATDHVWDFFVSSTF